MYNLCYTLQESADLYHFTPCLIIQAQFSVVPYSVLEINSKLHVWTHLSGCLKLSLGTSRGCLKARRRREINYSTSMTKNVPFVPKYTLHTHFEKKKIPNIVSSPTFQIKAISSSQALLFSKQRRISVKNILLNCIMCK